MLCQFRFKNFSSYRDETVFDMQAAGIGELHNSLIPPPEGKFSALLPVSAIFGPNGGGKSNAINALAYLVSCVLGGSEAGTERHNPFRVSQHKCSPFLLDEESKGAPTEFELFFRTKFAQYQYQLSLLDGQVAEESLSYIKTPCRYRRPTFLFARSGGRIELGSALKRVDTQKVGADVPFLSFLAAERGFSVVRDAMSWFKNCRAIDVGVSDRSRQLSALLEDPDTKARLLALLAEMEIPISDCALREGDGGLDRRIVTTHTVGSRSYQLDLEDESEGTAKLLGLLPCVLSSLACGSPLLVDELDAKLHPQLLRRVIELYTDPKRNTQGAQLIFTCHDVSIMKNDLLRRDEIWFAAQNSEHVSELWSLYDIQDKSGKRVKSASSYDRQYLAGRYGADPYFNRILERI